MYDARIFVDNLEQARAILAEYNAECKGEYEHLDIIYKSRDEHKTLGDVFLRLRIIPKNIWNEKDFVVAIKMTELNNIGKTSLIPTKEEFDTEKEARNFIIQNYDKLFEYDLEFNRTGTQYFLGDDGVDLEEIEGNYSIEFKSKTSEGLANLLQLFNVNKLDIISGPSVVTMKDLLKTN